MNHSKHLDALVKKRLREWPQQPPGMAARPGGIDAWLRGRPANDSNAIPHPFLKYPGSDTMRTLPDGLWLNFGGTPVEPFVDIFAVEACATLPNLLDKRSRFAPSTASLLACCPVPWLLAPATKGDPTPRWKMTKVIVREPIDPFIVPVRDIRVLFGLKSAHYAGFARAQVPHAHEYFVPLDALMEADSADNPALKALMARATAAANFM